jgi:hypothetical protein
MPGQIRIETRITMKIEYNSGELHVFLTSGRVCTRASQLDAD